MDRREQAQGDPLKAVAIIPAAGAGVRMGTGRTKQFLELNGIPVLARTLGQFQASGSVGGVVLVVPPGEVDFCRRQILEPYGLTKVREVVEGGPRRQDSVRLGIRAAGTEFPIVLIHDGVRPLVSPGLIDRVIAFMGGRRAVIAALPAKETVKEVGPGGVVVRTYDRRQVWLVQTPQAFRYEDIFAVHSKAVEEGWGEMTDDAHMAERMGIEVAVVEGSEDNIKITTPLDLDLAAYLLKRRGRIENSP